MRINPREYKIHKCDIFEVYHVKLYAYKEKVSSWVYHSFTEADKKGKEWVNHKKCV